MDIPLEANTCDRDVAEMEQYRKEQSGQQSTGVGHATTFSSFK